MKIILIFFLIFFNLSAYGFLFSFKSIEDLSCKDIADYGLGKELQNSFGAKYEILKIIDHKELSRNGEEIVCVAEVILNDGQGITQLKMTAEDIDGLTYFSFITLNEFELNKLSQDINNNNIIVRSKSDLGNAKCKEIENENERLVCYDNLSETIDTTNSILIPSFKKIVQERKRSIPLSSAFYGCIEDVEWSKDILTEKTEMQWIIIAGSEMDGSYTFAQVYLDGFEGISQEDPQALKIDDCLAFEPLYSNLWKHGNAYSGSVKIFKGNYNVDNEVKEITLRDKMTVTEFFEQNVDYGNKIIELTGKINELDGNNSWFKIVLFSEKFIDTSLVINGFYYSDEWIDNQLLKQKLRSLKVGDLVTIKGNFGGPRVWSYHMGFEIIEIININ